MESPTMIETIGATGGADKPQEKEESEKVCTKMNGDSSFMNGDATNHEIKSSKENTKHSSSSHGSSKNREDGSPHKHSNSSSSKHKSGSSHSKSHHSQSSEQKMEERSGKDQEKHKDKSNSSSSDKHKSSSSSSEKHKSSSSSGDKHKSSSSSGDKHKSSSSSGDKHKSSSSSGDKHKSSSSSSDKHKSSSEDKHRSSSSSGDKHKSSSSSGDKHKSSSSSGDKHKSSSSSGDKHKSSSSSGDKHKSSSSSGDKHKSSSSSGDKHKSSSSSGDKHKSSSSSGDKHKSSASSGEKHKSGSSSNKHKEDKENRSNEIKEEPMEVNVKKEPQSPTKSAPVKTQEEAMSDDDIPLSKRIKQEKTPKRELESDDEDEQPLSARIEQAKKVKKETPAKSKKDKKRKSSGYDEDSEDEKPLKKKKKIKTEIKEEKGSPTKKKKKEPEHEVWKWWEEERREDGAKWTFLEHKGVVFAPDYEPLPDDVKFYYNGKPMKLSPETEEVATFYGRMLDHDYTTKEVFNKNFFKDWRKVMTSKEKETIEDLKKCNFKEIDVYFKKKSEERKAMSKQEKLEIKKKNEEIQNEYGICIMDGHKEKIGNFRIEPPGLFRGRGDHPKQGMLKRRTQPEDVIINCSKDSKIPVPPPGHKWKEVRHDNTVSWLASWTENIQGQTKYVMLNAASRLKGEKDWQKYETARNLYRCVDSIREGYRNDWKSKEMRIRQRAVALYFIDKLALRAGNEKEEGETADTVGCCSLRVEHIKLHENYDNLENVVEFDFLGKDSIRYYNRVAVERRVFKNLQLFVENKSPGDDLFDRLTTASLNKHLHELMDGLTAKVFRTFNASKTLQEQLKLLTDPDDPIPAKLLSYNRANRAVAVLCNHQRAAPKNFDKQMENMQNKIDAKKDAIREAKKAVKDAKADYKAMKTEKAKQTVEKKKKMVERLEEQLTKLEVQATDKDENKEIALGTSKLNYLDPRISVAWCKKWEVPIEKVYNKTQREKFRWAIDMADETFEF